MNQMRWVSTVGLLAILTVVACTDNPVVPPLGLAAKADVLSVLRSQLLQSSSSGAVSPGALSEITAAVHGRQYRGAEDEILRLENVIPGLGGVFIDTTQNLVVYAPKGIDPAIVKAALAPAALEAGLASEFQTQLRDSARVQVIPGAFPFSQLIVWQGAITSRLVDLSYIAGIDADEAHNQVRVVISNERARATVQQIAAALGIPPEGLLVEKGPQMVPLAGLRGTWRPTGGGIQLAVDDGRTCTLGFNVTTVLGVTGFLTASHCALGQPGVGRTGDTFYQPMIGPTYVLGRVTINPSWNLADTACYGFARCTDSDVLFVTYDNTANADKKNGVHGQPRAKLRRRINYCNRMVDRAVYTGIACLGRNLH